jgi:glycosyltransferase involved in cell wall biosynthesis
MIYIGSESRVLRILWFNWRDIRNPHAGGAEVLTHEVASRLIKKGDYDITLFSSYYPGSQRFEIIDGVKILRDGGFYTVYEKAKIFYKKNKDSYDLIIDEINGKPFLTPKFSKNEKPIIALIHSMHRELFLLELPFPLNYLGYYYFEKKWLSYYKTRPTLTVSHSSKKGLESIGFKNVSVIPQGLSVPPLPRLPQKESLPTMLFIGRLKRHKLPDHAILAFLKIKKQINDARLWVIGDGYMRDELQKRFNMPDIVFYGRVNFEMKYELLSKAHITLVPATHEGWGLVVTESNAVGTPAVAYNVPGLTDSVRDGETGIIVKENSPDGLASSAITLLKDRALLEKLAVKAISFARQFSWDITTDEFDRIVKETMIKCPSDIRSGKFLESMQKNIEGNIKTADLKKLSP